MHEILIYPHPGLLRKADSVVQFDDKLQQTIAAMFATMYAASGIGLAAVQVNIHQQILVLDTSPDQSQAQVFINPSIIAQSGHRVEQEGCLSFPGLRVDVGRAEHVTVQACDQTGKAFTLAASGLLARCLQHEIDHLNGVLFIEHISRLKRQRIITGMRKQARKAQRAPIEQ